MRLLLIDGEKYCLEYIVKKLRKTYVVDVFENGAEGVFNSQINEYDLIIVGTSLPDIDGDEVCSMIRSAGVTSPIILFNNSNKPLEKVMSLDAGADVILKKPIDCDELVAQIRALIRRCGDMVGGNILKVGALELNIKSKQVCVGDNELKFRRKEFDVLEYLLVHKYKIVSKEELLEHIWDDGINIFSNTVEVHIRNIRNRVRDTMGDSFIKTVRRFGYKIETCENDSKALLSD